MTVTRLVSPDDAPALAALLRDNREFLAPWHPTRPDDYFTADGQREAIEKSLDQHAAGASVPLVISRDDGTVAGTISLQSVIRGALQSCSVGYWLAEDAQGRGLATIAVREAVAIAFDTLRLHRVEAGTLPHNERSQRVLERVGFVRYGMAPKLVRIAGEWQDHVLYQLLTPTPEKVNL